MKRRSASDITSNWGLIVLH